MENFLPESGLGLETDLLEMLFDHMPMGIAIIGRDYVLRRCNPTWAAFIGQYTPSKSADAGPGANIFDLEPGTEEALVPLFERVFDGETIRQDAVRIESGGIASYWDIVLSPLFEDGQVVGLLNVSIDATERVQAERRLKETLARLEESESMLRSVIENAQNFAIYRVQVDPANPYHGKVVLVSPSIQELLGVEDPYRFETWFEHLHPEDYPRVVEANRRSLEEGIAYNQPARFFNSHQKRWRWVQTISNPSFDAAGQLTHFDGMIIDLTEQKEAELALQDTLASLEQRVDERTHELSTLLEVSQKVNSTLDLDPLLGVILDQLKSVVDYNGASLMELADDQLKILAYRGPIPPEQIAHLHLPFQLAGANQEVIRKAKPVVIPDVLADSPLARAFRSTAGERLHSTFGYIRCWMGVPLIVREHVIGMLSLDHANPNYYSQASANLVLAFANQAAGAIENARLYTETTQRADEIQTLFAVQQAITSRLELKAVLQLIADEACRLTSAHRAAVFLLDGENVRVAVEAGEKGPSQAVGRQIPLRGSIIEVALAERHPIWIKDTRLDPHIQSEDSRRAMIEEIGARSLMIVPLLIGGQPAGVLSITDDHPGSFNTDDERVLSLLASSAVIGIENARLYEQVQTRRRELQVLLDVTAAANSSLNLDEMLATTLDRLVNLVGASRAGVMLVDETSGKLGKSLLRPERFATPEDMRAMTRGCQRVIDSGEPLFIAPDTQRGWIEPGALLPLQARGETLGVLGIIGPEGGTFNSGQLTLFRSIADELGVALENAHLYEQAAEIAVLSERNRLARDLHDAVTQTLFSATLIAEVLPKLWDRSPELGRQKLNELRSLTRGALSEMRTLLLELRPDTLGEVDLGDLYRHLTNAFTGRTGIQVTFNQEGKSAPPPEVKETFYRVGQEALNNIAKHAAASIVEISLKSQEQRVEVVILDNGCGFDLTSLSPENLGLRIMRERAEAVHAELEIESAPGAGTRIIMCWKATQEKK